MSHVLEAAIAEARAAGLTDAADKLEQRAFAVYTTSSEVIGEQTLAIREFLRTAGGAVPPGVKDKLKRRLVELNGPGPYDRFILPYLIDLACGLKPVRRQRRKVVPQAHGRVLEIGIGTGLNLPHYDKSRIEKVVGLDPGLHWLARRRMQKTGVPLELVALSAEKIPFDPGTFDSIVCTYSLCTIPDAAAALLEMRRVLKPGGVLLFSEHGRAPDESVRRWQDRLTPIWSRFSGGCHLNRDIPALLAQGGFHSQDLVAEYLPGPRPMTFNYSGSARVASS